MPATRAGETCCASTSGTRTMRAPGDSRSHQCQSRGSCEPGLHSAACSCPESLLRRTRGGGRLSWCLLSSGEVQEQALEAHLCPESRPEEISLPLPDVHMSSGSCPQSWPSGLEPDLCLVQEQEGQQSPKRRRSRRKKKREVRMLALVVTTSLYGEDSLSKENSLKGTRSQTSLRKTLPHLC